MSSPDTLLAASTDTTTYTRIRDPRLLTFARTMWLVAAALVLATSAFVLYAFDYNLRLAGAGLIYEDDPGSGRLIISYVIPGSPAAEAGLRVGDALLAANGDAIDPGSPLWEAGEPGSTLTLTVRSVDGEFKDYPIARRAGWYGLPTIGALLAGLPLDLYVGYVVAMEAIFVLVSAAVAASVFWRRSDDWMGLLGSLVLLLLAIAIGMLA